MKVTLENALKRSKELRLELKQNVGLDSELQLQTKDRSLVTHSIASGAMQMINLSIDDPRHLHRIFSEETIQKMFEIAREHAAVFVASAHEVNWANVLEGPHAFTSLLRTVYMMIASNIADEIEEVSHALQGHIKSPEIGKLLGSLNDAIENELSKLRSGEDEASGELNNPPSAEDLIKLLKKIADGKPNNGELNT